MLTAALLGLPALLIWRRAVLAALARYCLLVEPASAWPAGEMDSRPAVLRSGCRTGLRHDIPGRGRHPGPVPAFAPSGQFAGARAARLDPDRELRRDRDTGPGLAPPAWGAPLIPRSAAGRDGP